MFWDVWAKGYIFSDSYPALAASSWKHKEFAAQRDSGGLDHTK